MINSLKGTAARHRFIEIHRRFSCCENMAKTLKLKRDEENNNYLNKKFRSPVYDSEKLIISKDTLINYQNNNNTICFKYSNKHNKTKGILANLLNSPAKLVVTLYVVSVLIQGKLPWQS